MIIAAYENLAFDLNEINNAWIVPVPPNGRMASVQFTPLGAIGSAVVEVKRSVAGGEWSALISAIATLSTGTTSKIDVQGMGSLRFQVTTAAGAALYGRLRVTVDDQPSTVYTS